MAAEREKQMRLIQEQQQEAMLQQQQQALQQQQEAMKQQQAMMQQQILQSTPTSIPGRGLGYGLGATPGNGTGFGGANLGGMSSGSLWLENKVKLKPIYTLNIDTFPAVIETVVFVGFPLHSL